MPDRTSTGPHNARVQVLAAEVRTLMVGSRQVTLSVYGQLDTVSADDIEPFGRVRPKDMQLDYIYLIGKHRRTGVLVRSVVPGGPHSIAREFDWREYSDEIEDFRRTAVSLEGEIAGHRKFEDDCHQKLPDNHRCLLEVIQAKEAELRAARDEMASLQREYDEITAPAVARAAQLAALPLIVLAGLR